MLRSKFAPRNSENLRQQIALGIASEEAGDTLNIPACTQCGRPGKFDDGSGKYMCETHYRRRWMTQEKVKPADIAEQRLREEVAGAMMSDNDPDGMA